LDTSVAGAGPANAQYRLTVPSKMPLPMGERIVRQVSSGPHKTAIQTTSRSVHPFSHNSPRSPVCPTDTGTTLRACRKGPRLRSVCGRCNSKQNTKSIDMPGRLSSCLIGWPKAGQCFFARQHFHGATENARHEFAAPVCTGGKCGT